MQAHQARVIEMIRRGPLSWQLGLVYLQINLVREPVVTVCRARESSPPQTADLEYQDKVQEVRKQMLGYLQLSL